MREVDVNWRGLAQTQHLAKRLVERREGASKHGGGLCDRLRAQLCSQFVRG